VSRAEALRVARDIYELLRDCLAVLSAEQEQAAEIRRLRKEVASSTARIIGTMRDSDYGGE
jgi:hypothetical protein